MGMVIKVLNSAQVHADTVTRLGFDPSTADLSFTETRACAVRHAAGLLCPTSPRTLVNAVVEALRGLNEDPDLCERIEDMVEILLGHGDLLELKDTNSLENPEEGVLVYLAPPSFVERDSGTVMLLGLAPDDVPLLPEELMRRIEHRGHARFIFLDTAEDVSGYLRQLGFVELGVDMWLKTPSRRTPREHLDHMTQRLEAAGESGEIPGLYILDSTRPVRYYRRRWIEPKGQTGNFIARRPQAYGADLWCFVQLDNGRCKRLLDLPVDQTKERGCDQAWYLQAAIDALRGEPQRYRLRSGIQGMQVIDFFSPVPMWAQRRWECFGRPVEPSQCLFSYSFLPKDIEEETKFAAERLWLARL